jgi:hypothetical protein
MSHKEMLGFVPSFEEDQSYRKKYWELYIQNELLFAVAHQSILQVQMLKQRLQQVEDEYRPIRKRLKHVRRRAMEITKDKTCPYQGCGKKYGSDTSLKAHIKFKHNS